MKPKILLIKKISALDFYYNGSHPNKELIESDKEQKEKVEEIAQILKNSGISYDIVTRKELSEELIDKYDTIMSLGGDGTVIATAAFNKNKPQFNIKTDTRSRGALCYEPEDIKKFLNEDYSIEEWTRQDVFLNNQFIGRALNETAIGENMNFTKMARYLLNSCPQKNSGIVIVTGNGSTGWPAAFKPYSRKSKKFKFRTIFPMEGAEKGEGDYFKINYRGHEGRIALDTIEQNLPRDSLLEIKLSDNPLRIIRPKNDYKKSKNI